MFLRRFIAILLLLIPASLITSILGFDITNLTLLLSFLVVFGGGYLLSLLSLRIYKRYGLWYTYFIIPGILFLLGTLVSGLSTNISNVDLLTYIVLFSYGTYMLMIVITAYFLFVYDTAIQNFKK